MSENSKIEWTDHTFNPWEGCQKVGPGCDHCYAETRNARFAGGTAINWGPDAPRRRTSASNWELPRRWNAQARAFMAQHGRRQRVFCASLADVFDNAVDHQWRADLLALIRDTPNLDWLLLTKRIGNVLGMVNRADDELRCPTRAARGLPPDPGFDWPLQNVWLGATIVNQAEADRDIPKLLNVPARVRFLSMEPLLAPVSLRWLAAWPENTGRSAEHPSGDTDHLDGLRRIDWVIVGGESGPGARPMHPDWARSIRDQCAAAGVPFLFKQWGEWASVSEVPGEGPHFTFPDRATVRRVGKKAAGRLLDGQQHDGFPE